MSAIVIFLPAGTTTWTVPTNWNSLNNTVEAIGSGANGLDELLSGSQGGTGGGGGAYAKISNLALTGGAVISVQVGAGNSTLVTRFKDSSTLVADYGRRGTGYNLPGAGGLAANSVGTVKFSGGSGGAQGRDAGSGGGGSAGPNGPGANGGIAASTSIYGGSGGGGANNGSAGSDSSANNGGVGGNGVGGTGGGTGGSPGGGNGSNGGGGGGAYDVSTDRAGGSGGSDTAFDATHGCGGGGGGGTGKGAAVHGNGGAAGGYGGGGGGAGYKNSSGGAVGGAGAPGLIVITYTPAGFVGAVQASAATSSGQAKVKAAATGTVQAQRATASGTSKSKIAGAGSPQASPASIAGTSFAKLAVSGSVFAGSATATGIAKPPPLQIAAQAAFGQVHIVEFEALQRAETRTAVQWVIPWGVYPWGGLPTIDLGSSAFVTFQYSDAGYISPSTGTSPDTAFEGRVTQPLRITRTIPVVPEASRRVAVDVGAVEIINVDGLLDNAAAEYSVDGRPVRVMLGLNSYTYDEFTPVFTGRAQMWVADFDKLTIEARDQSYLLEVPLLKQTYAGTGGLEGTDSLTGKPKPYCAGQVFNIEPVFVDPPHLVYQCCFRQVQSFDAVYDRGAVLTFAADYPTYAALIAATVSSGYYATCKAFGLIRTGSTPTMLTADVKGDAVGGYVSTTAAIAQRMMVDLGPFETTDMDLVLWSALDAEVPGTIGWYRTEQILISDAVSEIVGNCGAFWGADFNGLIGASILAAPDVNKIGYYFCASDVRDIARLPPASGTFPPRWRQRVGYARNWTPMSGENIAGAVSDARRQFLNEEYRFAFSLDQNVQTEFLTALDPDPLLSLFVDVAPAQEIADVLLALLKKPRQTIRITTGFIGYIPALGSTVNLTHPRVANNQGWDARLIDVDIDAAAGQITLVLWG